MRATDVVDLLVAGSVFLRPVTFPEGLTIAEMAAVFESAGLGTSSMFTAAARRGSLVRRLTGRPTISRATCSPRLTTAPRHRGGDAGRADGGAVPRRVRHEAARRGPEARGLTTREVVTIASLIEKETSRPEERPLVSAVMRPDAHRHGDAMRPDRDLRAAAGRPLDRQPDAREPAVRFALQHLSLQRPAARPDRRAGAGLAQAAVAPAGVPYLYFVSRNDGSHVFAATLAEHNRNVQQHRVQYFRDQRRAAGRK